MNKYADFFVSATIHEREVELADGSKHKLHFKELPVSVYRRFQIAESSDDVDVRSGSLATLVSSSMCEADGSPAITYDEAMNLKPSVSTVLVNAVLEVNGRKPGNAPPPGEKSGSGTSSPSPSAADQ